MAQPSRRRMQILAAAATIAAAGAAMANPASASTGAGSQRPEIVKGGLVQARAAAAIDQLLGKSAGPVNPAKRGGGGGGSTIPQNGINYHGGPVLTGTKDVYLIWYGDWSGVAVASSNPKAQSLIDGFVGSIGGSPYFNINTTYVNGSLTKVSNAVTYAGSTTDAYSQGTALSDAGVQAVVQKAIAGGLPADPNGVYFVLTSGDVTETSGFLTKYCGWHTYTTVSNTTVQYSFVGDPAANTTACSAQTPGPNGTSVGNADAMVSVIAHELEESATDPQLNAWYDRRGYENADKCAWKFGTTSTVNGAQYNMTLGGTNYLVQQNWVNASGGFCGLSY